MANFEKLASTRATMMKQMKDLDLAPKAAPDEPEAEDDAGEEAAEKAKSLKESRKYIEDYKKRRAPK